MKRFLIGVVLNVACAAVVAASLWFVGVEFHGPHRLTSPKGRFGKALSSSTSTDVDNLIEESLEEAYDHLRFSLGHKTSFRFSKRDVQPGNCVEYTNYVAKRFNVLAKKRKIDGQAWVVRSRAKVFGLTLPIAALASHDWVLIKTPTGPKYIDPTFGDIGLPTDITHMIISPPDIPK